MRKQFERHQKGGFTLIELLVVIFLIATVGGIAISILFSALRGANKSNSLAQIRQSGNYTISQISKMITFAKVFNGVSNDGSTYKTSCIDDSTAYQYVQITAFDNGITTFSCPSGSSTAIASASATYSVNLTDSNLTVTSCSFYCWQSNILSDPTITIDFTLNKGTAASAVENQAQVHFQTSVTPRN